jgi:hypothetical protein
MYPYTENWKPAWRSLHRIGCVLAGCATSLLVVMQIYWAYWAFIVPHNRLELSIGEPLWTAITIAHFDDVSFRGGERVWNLVVTASQAEKLRARCGETTHLRSIADARALIAKNIVLIAPTVSSTTAVEPKPRETRSEYESRQPQGCVLGSEREPGVGAGSTAMLAGQMIQINEWVD